MIKTYFQALHNEGMLVMLQIVINFWESSISLQFFTIPYLLSIYFNS